MTGEDLVLLNLDMSKVFTLKDFASNYRLEFIQL